MAKESAAPTDLRSSATGAPAASAPATADENNSRSAQFASVDRTAAQFGLPTLPGDFYDSDASGSTFERPQWEKAIKLCATARRAASSPSTSSGSGVPRRPRCWP
jgi:hypothetical protein